MMTPVAVELSKEFTVFRVFGALSFEEMVKAVKEFYPLITRPHIIWDFSEGVLAGVTAHQLQGLLSVVKEFSPDRKNGRTAMVSPHDATYGQFRQYTIHAEMDNMPFSYKVCRRFEEAVDWISTGG